MIFAKANVVSETKLTGKADGVTFQQRCYLRVAFPIMKTSVTYMVRTESAHRRDNLKSICTKNCPKKHPRRSSNIIKMNTYHLNLFQMVTTKDGSQ